MAANEQWDDQKLRDFFKNEFEIIGAFIDGIEQEFQNREKLTEDDWKQYCKQFRALQGCSLEQFIGKEIMTRKEMENAHLASMMELYVKCDEVANETDEVNANLLPVIEDWKNKPVKIFDGVYQLEEEKENLLSELIKLINQEEN